MPIRLLDRRACDIMRSMPTISRSPATGTPSREQGEDDLADPATRAAHFCVKQQQESSVICRISDTSVSMTRAMHTAPSVRKIEMRAASCLTPDPRST
ncbi:MAG TPA: hypothetical protein VIM12_04100 [Noviherbaspirillum sp.]|uniref:hypothetical protein n=1 Tax=Noviherbaspirillum sp. TaxID=1926288 RepID=UPI002F940936